MEVTCESCGLSFDRRNAEVNRSLAKGRKQYCSRSCAGKDNPMAKTPPDLSEWFGKRTRDEYSDFRPHLARTKARNYDVDIDLPYLKELWEKQKGKCPFTGWKLLPVKAGRPALPNTMSIDRIDNNKGYIIGNVRWVSCMANLARNKWKDQDLIDFSIAVVQNK